MIMKLYFLITTVAFVSCTSKNYDVPKEPDIPEIAISESGQNKYAALEKTIIKLVDAYNSQNQEEINSLVNKNEGVVTLYRTGVFNEFKRSAIYDFDNPVPPNYKYPHIPAEMKLQFTILPKFDCGSDSWDKYGLYCDTIYKDTMLSGTLENLRTYRGDKIDSKEIMRMKKLEQNSVRIVLAQKDFQHFIFYLTLIEKRWYFTAHDRITGDCSA
jgi:hypothetical protein